MNPVRYNIFEKSHNQLHAIIFEIGSVLQHTGFSKPENFKKIFKYINRLAGSFEFHITQEDEIIYQAVSLEAPYIIAIMEKRNTAILELSESVIKKVNEYKNISTDQDRIQFENDLQTEFFSFTAISLQQLIKEDTVINQLLWNIYDDAQLKNMETAISENIADSAIWYEEPFLSKKTEVTENQLSYEMMSNTGYDIDPVGIYTSHASF